MRKIRIGNDFALLWKIRRGEQAEDLTEAQEMSLKLWVQGDHNSLKENIPFDIVGSDTVRVEVTPSIADKIGRYRLEFKYQFVNLSNADKNQKCAVDVEPFYIVPLTEIAETIDTVNCESDVLIGLRGRAFVYDDFTPEQIEDLKRPAVEAAESVQIVENQISINEQGRVQAENERETAELTRQSSESERNENEGLRVNAEGLRVTAESSRELTESLRVDAELLRQSSTQEAITNAENATENANTAAQDADDAREAIQDDLALKANHGYESNPKTLKEIDDEKADSSLLGVVELIGDNDNYVIGEPIKGVINGRRYRLWLKNKDIDMSGVSHTSSVYMMLRIYLQSTTEQIDLHTVRANNRVMQHYYDFTIPDDGIQYTLGINIRATLGEQAIFVLEDVTNEEDDFFYKVRIAGIIPSGNPGYITRLSGKMEPSTISLYRFIKIESGEKVVLKCRAGDMTSAISFAQDLETTTVVPKIIGLGDTIDGVYEYVATENGYVVISWHKDYPVNVRIYSQEDYNINQLSNIYFNRKTVDSTFTSGYITRSGSIANSSISHYSSPILLHKGETVWVYAMGMDATAIAITTENGETYKPVVLHPDEPVVIGGNFKYTATEDVYVSVSGRVEGFRAEITSLNLPKNDGSYPKLLQYSRQLETEWNSWETNNYSLSSLKMKKEAGKLPITMGYYFSDYPQKNGKLYFSPTLLGKPELIVDFNDNSGLPNINLERSVIAVSPKHNSVITSIFDRSPGQGLRIYEDSTFAHVNKEEPMQAWLYNSGLDFVSDAEGNEYCIYGEYSHGLKPTRRIFKGNYPYSNPDNWRVVHTFPSDETEGSIIHIHQIQKDPFSDFIYCTTGDYGTQSQVHYSADLGETWNVLIEDKPQGYLRMINFIFLENEIYWASDDNRHYLFRATRDENGLLDPESVELVTNLPVRQSTNSTAYIKEKNCLFFYDRISPDYEGEPITTCIYDIEKKELIEVGKLFPRKVNPPLGLWGNRGKCYVHYPNSADRRLAMGIVDEYAPCNFDFIGNDGKTFGTVIYELV